MNKKLKGHHNPKRAYPRVAPTPSPIKRDTIASDLKGIRESSSLLAKGYMDLCSKLDSIHSEEKSLRMCIGESIMCFLLQQVQLEVALKKELIPGPSVEDSYRRLMDAIKEGCQHYNQQQRAPINFADRELISNLMGWGDQKTM